MVTSGHLWVAGTLQHSDLGEIEALWLPRQLAVARILLSYIAICELIAERGSVSRMYTLDFHPYVKGIDHEVGVATHVAPIGLLS